MWKYFCGIVDVATAIILWDDFFIGFYESLLGLKVYMTAEYI